MYYVYGNKFKDNVNWVAVVDTKDWVLDWFTVKQLDTIKKDFKINVMPEEFQSKVLSFYMSYIVTQSEVGGSTMDFVDRYLEAGDTYIFSELGSSDSDLVKDLRKSYVEIKKTWEDLDVESFGREDKLFIGIQNLILDCRLKRGIDLDNAISVFQRNFPFKKDIIKKCIYL